MGDPKVLIVEDEAIVAMQLEMNLRLSGFLVLETVASGEEAVRAAEAESPEVILMDRRLIGEMDGLAAARRIRGFSRAPIVFLSGYMDEDIEAITAELEPADYLIKPVRTADIEASIQKLLGVPG